MDPASILAFRRGVRFRFDETRQAWVLLAPERLLLPDEQAVSVLSLVDGQRRLGEIINTLAEQFEAPPDVIRSDVVAMLQDLQAKGIIEAA